MHWTLNRQPLIYRDRANSPTFSFDWTELRITIRQPHVQRIWPRLRENQILQRSAAKNHFFHSFLSPRLPRLSIAWILMEEGTPFISLHRWPAIPRLVHVLGSEKVRSPFFS